jgi:hypothetical protein
LVVTLIAAKLPLSKPLRSLSGITTAVSVRSIGTLIQTTAVGIYNDLRAPLRTDPAHLRCVPPLGDVETVTPATSICGAAATSLATAVDFRHNTTVPRRSHWSRQHAAPKSLGLPM